MELLVQGTNDCSILSKYSMVRRGYFEDDAIKYFITKDARRSPIIHLGYFARAVVMDYAIQSFIQYSGNSNPQILSLGAGYDTTYFRLRTIFPYIDYFEVDLKDVVDHKIAVIKNSPELIHVLCGVKEQGFSSQCLSSKNYNIFSHDLTDVHGLDKKLAEVNFDFERPTLLFSECAITYIQEERSTALLKWIKHKIKRATFMNYEQFNPHDGFGKVMVNHFNKIQNPLKSLTKYTDMEEQQKRYLDAGWERCNVYSVIDMFQHILDQEKFVNAFRIEPFDEWEEFHLKCCHYSLAIATDSEDFLKLFSVSKSEIYGQKELLTLQTLQEHQVERYAHSCVVLSDKGVLLIGGFASNVGHHQRTKLLTYVGASHKTVTIGSSSFVSDCLYATVTAIGEDEFIIFGGRTSPTKEVNLDPTLITVEVRERTVELSSSSIHLANTNRPSPRWRHNAVCLNGSVIVFGGRNKDLQVFGDLWELRSDEKRSWQWFERKPENDCYPCARFSHAMTTGGDKIYLSGGLNVHLRPNNDIWELKISGVDVKWTQIKPEVQEMVLMYGHSMHYYRNQLIFVGGVNTSPTNQPSLTILDLTTLQLRFFEFDTAVSNEPVMLHNHSTILDDAIITCYGGGGNCFSFGTHFNRHPLRINLDNIMNLSGGDVK